MSEETHNQILALKAKHETDKLNFETKIMDLQQKLQERDDNELDRTRSRDLKKEKENGGVVEFSNPAALLKNRLQKWLLNNKEKKNLMDMYIRNVKIIEDAFEQIKEQTGISANQEIVTTFCKSEEQNYSLYNYVNTLNNEIDIIDEQNKAIEDEIRRHEELCDMNNLEKDELRQKLDADAADLADNIA